MAWNTMLAGDYTYNNMGPNLAPDLTPSISTSNLGSGSGAGAAGSSNPFSVAAPIMMAMGAIQSAVGAYYQASSAKYQLQSQQLGFEFNQKMADINARQMENQAQWYMLQGERQIGQLTMRAGKIRSAQKASQAARGISLGYGSTAEEIATTDLMKETDAITININATRAANSARTQKVNFENQSLLSGVSASNAGAMAGLVNPWASAGTSMIQSASSVAGTWYKDQKLADYLSAISQSRS